MHVVETVYVLFEVGEGFIWRDKASVDEEVEQFAGYDVIEFCEALEDVVDAHDIEVVHELHHCNFLSIPRQCWSDFACLVARR